MSIAVSFHVSPSELSGEDILLEEIEDAEELELLVLEVEELFKLQGEDINTMPTRKLEKLLPVSDTLLDRARRDLKNRK